MNLQDIPGDGAVPNVEHGASLHGSQPDGMASGSQPPPEPQPRALRTPGKFSPQLVQMLLDLTPAPRDEAAKIAGKLLAIRARKARA